MGLRDAKRKEKSSQRTKIARLKLGFTGVCLGLATFGTFVIPQSLWGQNKTAQVDTNSSGMNGVVTDTGGYPVANAEVTLENLQTHKQLHSTTDSAGDFNLVHVQAGQYKLLTSKDGFKTFLIRTLPLLAGDSAKAAIQLEPGSTMEIVEGAMNSVMSKTGFALAGKELTDIPENQRNFVNMAQMAVGANEGTTNVADSSGKAGTQHASSAVSVAGQFERLNNYMVNGVDNTMYQKGTVVAHPSVDAIGEMQILASNIPASEGNASGGVINLKTKAGTEKYHGNLYEYFRNDALDAYPYQFGAANPFKSEVRQNQFGGSFSGPLHSKKTTLFFAYENFRLIQGRPMSTLIVPTQYEHDHPGDFTDVGGSNYTGKTDSVGLFYFKLFPAPNASTNEYVASPKGSVNTGFYDGRVDHEFSSRDKMYVFVSFNAQAMNQKGNFPDVTTSGMTISPGGGVLATFGQETQPAAVYGVNYTHNFTRNLLVNILAGRQYTRDHAQSLNSDIAVNQSIGQPGINGPLTMNGLAPISVTKATIIGDAGYRYPYDQKTWATTYKVRSSYVHAKHDISTGFDLIHRTWSNGQSQEGLGYWSVADLPSLVQGYFTSVIRDVGLVNAHYQLTQWGIYVADRWQVARRLQFNIGLRYDVIPPITEEHNYLGNFDTDTGHMVYAGQNGVSRTANVQTDYSGVAPRFGFSATLSKETSLHGSWGMMARSFASGNVYNVTPYSYDYGPCSSGLAGMKTAACANGYTTLSAGLPTVQTPTATAGALSGTLSAARDKHIKNMVTQMTNFGVDHNVSKYDIVHVDYVGILGSHATRIFPDRNAPPPNTSSNPNTLRPFYSTEPNLTTVQFYDTEGSSNYNGLQAVYQHNTRFGISGQMNYTWAHSMDNARPWLSDTTGFGNVVSQTSTRDYGNSVFDVRNRIVSSIKYNVPFGNKTQGIRKIAEKGWVFNVAEIWSTSLPFTVLNANDVSNTNPGATTTSSDRPNVVGDPTAIHKSPLMWFNTAAFAAQTAGTLGDERKNQFFGPHNRHVDVSLFKNFDLTKSWTGQFRIEAFNVTNSSNFATPQRYLNGANFGKITQLTGGYTPRELQMVWRMQF